MFNYKKQLILKEIASFFIIVMGSYLFNQMRYHLSISMFIVFILWELAILMLSNNGISGRVLLRYSFYYVIILLFMKYFDLFGLKEINSVIYCSVCALVNISFIYVLKRIYSFILNFNKQNLKYNGCNYTVPFKVKLQVELSKSHLIFLRFLRNINRCLSYLKSLGIVVFAWIAFLLFMTCIDVNEKSFFITFMHESYKNAASIFTSIILVAFTTVYKENNNYKKILENQYNAYYSFLYEADSLIKKMCDIPQSESIFMCDTLEYNYICQINNRNNFNICISNYDIKEFVSCVSQVKELIDRNELIYWKENYGFMNILIKDILKAIDNEYFDIIKIVDFINAIYSLIEYTRKPWRRDFQENQKIRKLINRYDKIYSYPDYIFIQDEY